MRRTVLLTLAALLGFAASASARYYVPAKGHACKAHYVRREVKIRERRHGKLVRHHGKVVWVRQARCYHVAVKPTVKPPVATPPVPTPTPTPPPTPTPSPVPSHALVDPSYTQASGDNLRVTWAYDASAADGSPPPPGTLTLAVSEPNAAGPSGGCSINVDSGTSGGTCTVELPKYGNWNVTVSYSGASASVAPSTSTDTQDIEPLPVSRSFAWGTDPPTATPSLSANVTGNSAAILITDPNYEGATSIGVSDQLGDTCTAQVSGIHATCTMALSGTPTGFTINYPGGQSTTASQSVDLGGTQQVTTNWPAQTVPVASPSITLPPPPPSAPVTWDSWSATGQTGGTTLPGSINIIVGQSVDLGAHAAGSLTSDPLPQGYITFTIAGTPGGQWTDTNDHAAFPPNSADCSQSLNIQDQAVGSCRITFTQPGQYTVTPSFTDTGGVYVNGSGSAEVVNVS